MHKEITTVEELDALPVGSVVVDPFDDDGDAPVVICKASDGAWAALTTGITTGQAWWTSAEAFSASGGRLRVVYLPGVLAPSDDDLEALARTARDLQAVRYDCDCQVGGVDATSIDADYLHAVGRRIEHMLAARQPAPVASAEQVERLARARADEHAAERGMLPWDDGSWAYIRHEHIQDETSRLRDAGIEVLAAHDAEVRADERRKALVEVSVERIAEVLDALDAERAVAFRAWSLDTDPATARTPPAEVSNAARAERIHAALLQTESNEEGS